MERERDIIVRTFNYLKTLWSIIMFKIKAEFPYQLNSGHMVTIIATCDRVYHWDAENLTLKFTTMAGDPLEVVFDENVFAEIEYEAIHWLLYEKDEMEDDINGIIVEELTGNE